ncbi:hypothetical protein [Paenibacillus sp. YYML68]|uniref:hypothetical protein n=1 Tax=Paenibacillus sp. YYML68 TaxID=2909250 RepID=UPI0024910B08|nr:hypothetical protein [Paenibacillus sp. YYML68]
MFTRKFLKLTGVTLIASMLAASSALAMPAEQDILEPANNAESTTYQMSQNVWTSYIQYSSDIDFITFVSPKTMNQEMWFLPPYGKNYAIGIYEYGSGTPLAYKQSYGNYVTMNANLVAGKKYTVLVFPIGGTYDTETPYYIGFPYLFPY